MNVPTIPQRTSLVGKMARYGSLLLLMLVLDARLARADDAAEHACDTVEQGLLLHVDGTYGGYPYSVLRAAVLGGLTCPSDKLELQAFGVIAIPPPHMRITVMRPVGQGQQGTISAMLYAQGRFVIGERMSLSSFSRTQSPASVKADISLVTTNLWRDLGARITHNKPIIP